MTSRSTAKTVRDKPIVTTGSLWEVTTRLLRGPISNPYDHPFSPNWGSQPPVKTCITTMVCIDSLWEHTIALPNSTIVDALGASLPQKGSDVKSSSPKFWPRPRPRSFGLGLSLGLTALASASRFWPRSGLDLVVLLCNWAFFVQK